MNLVGLDVSRTAIAQLAGRMPGRGSRLVVGDLSAIRDGTVFSAVVGIQVFQHGDRRRTHDHIRAALQLVAPSGLICVRVNAVGTDVAPRHEIAERFEDGGFTVRYLEGPKCDLDVHFFSRQEITGLIDPEDFEPVLALRRDETRRSLPQEGQWSQREGIWRRRRAP